MLSYYFLSLLKARVFRIILQSLNVGISMSFTSDKNEESIRRRWGRTPIAEGEQRTEVDAIDDRPLS
jgi:hypothetical protein